MPGNQLANTTSPYLQQHAENPVDWYPWGEPALQLAQQSNKPILLSIGYSACHWCHVMAHESFEDEATAGLMNEMFINIKVDREERPDLDKIYQTAYQLMNQRGGGWPLTVFLTPDDHVPFYTGTYFPPEAAYGRPSFRQVLTSIDEAWRTREADIRQQNQAVLNAFHGMTAATEKSVLSRAPIAHAATMLEKSFDSPRGGFSGAPKFPHPDMLNQCLLNWFDSQQSELGENALSMAQVTGIHMALGGMNDQVGGGFCRYSTDADWIIPHFEKMLYDNGPLLGFYADLLQITGNVMYARVLSITAEWVMREMQSAKGGYFSSQDADSEGVEGKFYIWTPQQVESLLNEEQYQLVAQRFSLDKPANFEGNWHLHCDAQLYPDALNDRQQALWDTARIKLFTAREQRIHPGLDDKILTSWNALMIKGMVKAGRVLDDQQLIDSAQQSLWFIQKTLWKEGRLLAVHKDGISHLNAYLDDYAFLIEAILELLSVRWDTGFLDFATTLADVLIEQYQDNANGGFFFTSNEHENLIHRPKPLSDEATPAGNGIAVKVLIRLGYLLARTDYLEAAERALQSAWKDITTYPHAHCSLLQGLQEYITEPETIIIRGPQAKLSEWSRKLHQRYHPHRQIFAIDADERGLPVALKDKLPRDATCAYICQGMTCLAPIEDLQQLL